ncbi:MULTISPECIES: pseudouridine synthase [unclassified Coleofasciculus]|uniref:pseudouridine synthase n=1 Tax=unclassified Coleofasciculus TaxID=2692782 RepID=UPI00187E3A7D|nr:MULTISPECIES: pseudouridine synthase [unclassified Coleofasciculus]MBE9127354.1 rRNA pseudouridine synthase [Coleofasciculus sp. LEGE 07081]MBE9150662.1 rRNA pseudouridine synthase [Coleofasciculus sp. LEGE 07092]
MEERIQKILSQWGVASRRQAEKMILAGQVRLNGTVVHLGQKANPETDLLEINGKPLKSSERPRFIYLLLNKPAGVISTCRDVEKCNTILEKRHTVLDLLPSEIREGQGIHPVGRLDAESTGALILTNDGALTYKVTHPRHHVPKTYQVWVQDYPPESALLAWRQGVELEGRKTLPAQVRVLKRRTDQTLLEIVLKEGRNRQIRRVANLLGYRVIHLHRTAIGPIQLQLPGEPVLLRGHYRYLKTFEIRFLQNRIHPIPEKVPADTKEYRV